VTEGWGTLDFELTNWDNADRQARVLVFYEGQPDVQYGRDVWVPARSTLATWMLVGPAAAQQPSSMRKIQMLLYDRSEGRDRLVLPPTEERARSRVVLYRRREPLSTVLLDEGVPEGLVPGQLPQPESRADEVIRLVRVFRHTYELSDFVQAVGPGPLPPVPEAFDGIDHFVLASGRIAHDPTGMRALRQWLEQGSKVWVMLDQVEPDVVAPLLGEAFDFQVVDRVGLTRVQFESPDGPASPVQEFERPVDLVRVLLPPHEQARHTVNGWPAWFMRQVGRGKVLFTALGPRGWTRPRKSTDPRSRFPDYPFLPVPTEAMEAATADLQPPPQEEPFRAAAFQPVLTEEIGYVVVSRGTAALVFAAFLLIALALVLVLRRSRRSELLGWMGPALALGAAGTFVLLGETSRRAVAPTVAVAQIVDADPGAPEAAVHGLLAVYRPDSGPATLGAGQGGLVELDMSGLEGQPRRLVLTDRGAWHWEHLDLPAGVRLGRFRYTAPTGAPLTAVARFGPKGIEGQLAAGPFRGLADALLNPADGRNLAVGVQEDGTFRAGSADVLPGGQFLRGTLLTDQQQRREALYREFLKPRGTGAPEGRDLLLAWAEPIDIHFLLPPEARTVGAALLVVPLEFERPAPGERVTIPGPLVRCRRILRGAPARPTLLSRTGTDMDLRFQLPAAVQPFRVERARLAARIDAPSRLVTVTGQADGKPVDLYRADSPIDPIRVEITDERLLRLDEAGGVRVNFTVSDLPAGGKRSTGDDKWAIEYLELEVTGRVTDDTVKK
jgi:hypothetical protein